MGLFKRLNRRQKQTASQVSKDAFVAANGDRDAFEQLVKEDSRTKAIDPMLILLFVRMAMAIYDYFKNRSVTAVGSVADLTDDEVILGSVRYLKG